jgi:hypothetical protein
MPCSETLPFRKAHQSAHGILPFRRGRRATYREGRVGPRRFILFPCLVLKSGFRDKEPISKWFTRDESDRLSSDMRFSNEGDGQGRTRVSEGRARAKCLIHQRVNEGFVSEFQSRYRSTSNEYFERCTRVSYDAPVSRMIYPVRERYTGISLTNRLRPTTK